ncbi:beta galactosidase jelly roll domain-containing protein [Gillisia sp. M10.2A]|uniref:Beta galactosidase jelly roll domain-containing protein n=1 Tax=Gillisia lutea TaxID=2909668 RepID=A0ABS9EDZ9_9FLAO|nr:sialate O-acetylesterase [Gillisia lutea]MCF4101102.1 beta galactosidase jelly roll domain-containing protein [Gillisia lutea]
MKYLLGLLFFVFIPSTLLAQIRLPKLVDDGMVLQRDAKIKIWGWSSPEEEITLEFGEVSLKTKADDKGNWSLNLSNLQAGGPFNMMISGKNQIEIKYVYVGDVWLCSGQSNMETPMSRVAPLYQQEIDSANNEYIRYFEVPKDYDLVAPRRELSGGKWEAVNRQNIEHFSAVAYFFAKNLYETYNVPIGLINSSLGGSPVEAWLSEESLMQFPEYLAEVNRLRPQGVVDSLEKIDRDRGSNWYAQINAEDKGIRESWKSENFDDSQWKVLDIPAYWSDSDLGEVNGVVWFRKNFELSKTPDSKAAKLLMGRIVDADSVFVNGEFIGNTTYQYPPRRYTIPPGILKKGTNTISVKIINERGKGGFITDKPYELNIGETTIDLKGSWKYNLGVKMTSLEPSVSYQRKPEGLFNAMINPLTNYSIKGAIWYQGESNTAKPEEYQQLFSSMIQDWRSKWNQNPKNFPFLFVQLANFMESFDHPTDSNWARLRESQLKTLALPETGMAVTIDVGEWNDIHPLNKKPVGDRLAQAAKKVAYKEDVLPSGPIVDSYKIKGDSIIIEFKNVGKSLMMKGGEELKEFAIAGEDRNFVWANARMVGNKVIVSSPEIKNPVAVRYAWANNPDEANLYNQQGLPASPFRTDNW